MPRLQLQPPARFGFETSVQIYISHVNQGGHLDNAQLLTLVGIGAIGFSMQDILIEPFGAQVLGFTVGVTIICAATVTVRTRFCHIIHLRVKTAVHNTQRIIYKKQFRRHACNHMW